MVWHSHLFKSFPHFKSFHIVKGFSIVCETEVDVFLECSCFLSDPANVGSLIFGSSAFSKPSLDIWKFLVHVMLMPSLEDYVKTNLDSILKSKDITLSTKVHLFKAMVFPVVMYGCESWTIRKAEHQRIDAFEPWCWRRLLRVPWTARSSNQSILKEISRGCSLEGLMLKLKLQYFGHLI